MRKSLLRIKIYINLLEIKRKTKYTHVLICLIPDLLFHKLVII